MKGPIIYPPVEHKLPELFELIIEIDHILGILKYDEPVVQLSDWIDYKKRRQELTLGAENFIKQQKKP